MKRRLLYSLFLALFIICLIGCQNSSDSSPAQTVDSFLQAMQHQDYSSVKQYYVENVDNFPGFKNKVEDISPHVANELFNKMSDFNYTIEKITIDSNDSTKATATVTFRCYDLGSAFESIVLDYLDKDLVMTFNGAKDDDIIKEAEDIIIKKIDDTKQNFNRTIPISLTLKDNVWKVDKLDENPDLMNTLSGNILYTIKNLSETLESTTSSNS